MLSLFAYRPLCLLYSIPSAASVPLKLAGSLKQAVHYLQETGCPRRRMVGRGGLTHCHLPNARSLRSTKPEYHLLHALLSNLPDRLAFGGIASVQCGKEGTSLTGGMRDWGRGLLPLPLHDRPCNAHSRLEQPGSAFPSFSLCICKMGIHAAC